MIFDGETFNTGRDEKRLTKQFMRVKEYALKRNGEWFTLPMLADALGYDKASVPALSARLRDLRKTKFGAYTVERRYLGSGLWEYTVHA